MKIQLNKLMIGVIVCIGLWAAPSYAEAPPKTLTLQATVENQAGLLTGKKRVIVQLVEGANHTSVWEETHKDFNFIDGNLSLVLGTLTPLTDATFSIPTPSFRLIIEGEQTTINLHSVPYALRAHSADSIPSDLSATTLNITNQLTLGTATANGVLTVSGNAFFQSDIISSGNLNIGDKLLVDTSLNAQFRLNVVGTLNASAILLNGSPLQFETSPTLQVFEALVPTVDGLIVGDGTTWEVTSAATIRSKMGLGSTDTPTFNALSVGTTATQNTFQVGTNTIIVTDNKVGIGGTPQADFQVGSRLVVTGNTVGIGTTNPDSDVALFISGNVRIENGSLQGLAGFSDSDWTINQNNNAVFNQTHSVGIGTATPNGTLHVQTQSFFFQGQGERLLDSLVVKNHRVGLGTNDPQQLLELVKDGSQEQAFEHFLRVRQNDQVFFDISPFGMVGIGVDIPRKPFHVVTDGTDTFVVTDARIGVGTTEPLYLAHLISTENATLVLQSRTSTPSSLVLKSSTSPTWSMQTTTAGDFQVKSGSDSRLLITQDGNIGIGESLPSASLHIVADGNQALSVASGNVAIGLTTPSANLHIVGQLEGDPLLIQTSQNLTVLGVSSNGAVTIQSNERVNLNISATTTESALIRFSGSTDPTFTLGKWNDSQFVISEGTDPFFSYNASTDQLGIGTLTPQGQFHLVNGSETPFIVTSNQVGIRTQTPSASLHIATGDVVIGPGSIIANGTDGSDLYVQGNIVLDGNIVQSMGQQNVFTDISVSGNSVFATTLGAVAGIGTTQPSARLEIITSSDTESESVFKISSSATNLLMVTNTGKVGIGATEPRDTLSVSGNILASGNLSVSANTTMDGTLTVQGQLNPSDVNGFRLVDTVDANSNAIENVSTFSVATIHNLSGQNIRITGDVVIGSESIIRDALAGKSDLFVEGNLVVDGRIIQDMGVQNQFTSIQASENALLATALGFSVGVGTTEPTSRLHIVASSNLESESAFRINRTDLELLTILNNGAIGIGTATPQQALTISGNVEVSQNLTVTGNAAFNQNVVISGALSPSDINAFRLLGDVDANNVAIENVNTLNVSAVRPLSSEVQISGDVVIGPTSIKTGGLAGKSNLFVEGNLIIDGQIIQDMGVENSFTTIRATENAFLAINPGNAVGIGTTTPEGKLAIRTSSDSQNETAFVIENDTTTHVIVQNNGAVGIATDNPTALFSVSGNTLLSGNITVQGDASFSNTVSIAGALDPNTVNSFQLIGTLDGGSQSITNVSSLTVGQLSGTETAITINNKLQLDEDLVVGSPTIQNGATGKSNVYIDGNLILEGSLIEQSSGGPFRVSQDVGLALNSGAAVGVGTTTPQSRLAVIASSNSNSESAFSITESTNTLFFVRNDGKTLIGTSNAATELVNIDGGVNLVGNLTLNSDTVSDITGDGLALNGNALGLISGDADGEVLLWNGNNWVTQNAVLRRDADSTLAQGNTLGIGSGATLNIASGATINVESGAAFVINTGATLNVSGGVDTTRLKVGADNINDITGIGLEVGSETLKLISATTDDDTLIWSTNTWTTGSPFLKNNASSSLQAGNILTAASGSTINIASGSTLNVASGGQINVASGGLLEVEGSLVLGGSTFTSFDNFLVNSGDNLESGTLTIDDGAQISLSSGATLNVSSGATLNIAAGGTLAVEDGATINVSGGVDTTRLKVGADNINDITGIGLEVGSETLKLISANTDDDTLIWSTNTWTTGSPFLKNNASSSLQAGNILTAASGSTINIASGSTLNVASGGQINVASGGLLEVEGSLVLGGSTFTSFDNFLVNSGDNLESGTLTIDDGAQISLSSGATLNVSSGATLNIAAGGTLAVEDGATINVSGGVDTTRLKVGGDTINDITGIGLEVGSETLKLISATTDDETLIWSTNTWTTGSPFLKNNSSSSLQAGNILTAASGSTINIASESTLNVASGGQINVASGGLLEIEGSLVLGGSTFTSFDNFLVNSGDNLESGTLTIDDGAQISLSSGATLNVSSGATVNIAAGGNLAVEDGATINVSGGVDTTRLKVGGDNINDITGIGLEVGSETLKLISATTDDETLIWSTNTWTTGSPFLKNNSSSSLQAGNILTAASGSTINIASGATLNIASGGQLHVAGTLKVGSTSITSFDNFLLNSTDSFSTGTLTFDDGTALTMDTSSTININDGSAIVLNSGGKTFLENGAELEAKNGSDITVKNGGTLTIESGGTFALNGEFAPTTLTIGDQSTSSLNFVTTTYNVPFIIEWDNASNAGESGSWTKNAVGWGQPRLAPLGANNFAHSDASDGEDRVTFNIPEGARTAYISINADNQGGYFDVYTRHKNDNNWKFQRRLSSFQDASLTDETTNGFDGNMVLNIATGLEEYNQIGIINRRGLLKVSGLAYTNELTKGYADTGFVFWEQVEDKPLTFPVDIGGEDFIISTKNIKVDGAKLGVGGDPNVRLLVQDTTPTVARFISTDGNQTVVNIEAATGGDGQLIFKEGTDPKVALGYDSSLQGFLLQFNSDTAFDTTPKFVITDTYQVGVGTLLPSGNFHVFGTKHTLFADNDLVGIGTTTPNAAGQLTIDGAGDNSVLVLQSNDIYNAGINFNRLENDGVTFSIEIANNTGESERLRIVTRNASGSTEIINFTGTGRLGIGTTAPAAKFHVRENLGQESSFETGLREVSRFERFMNSSNLSSAAEGGYLGFALRQGGSGSATQMARISWRPVGTDIDQGQLGFWTKNTSEDSPTLAMTIDQSQRIGIGTTLPSHNLTIGGVVGFDESSGAHIRYNAKDSSGEKRIIEDEASSIELNDAGKILFKTAASAAADSSITYTTGLVVHNNGTVSVKGDFAPRGILDLGTAQGVSQNLKIGNYLEVGETERDVTGVTAHNPTPYFGFNAELADLTSGVNQFRPVEQNGEGIVMIGSDEKIGAANIDFYGVDWANSNSNKTLTSDFAHIMRIQYDGKVGIGTTEPEQPFTVSGNMQTTGNIKVSQGKLQLLSFTNSSKQNGDLWFDGTNLVFRKAGADQNVAYFSEDQPFIALASNFQFSDQRLKTKVKPISNALEKVNRLRGVSFVWKKDAPVPTLKGRQIGFIAQEVEALFPELVTQSKDGYKTVSYANMVAILVEALKEQQTQLDAQAKTIDDLQESNKTIHHTLEEILKELKTIKKEGR